jgi:hypothetical protein
MRFAARDDRTGLSIASRRLQKQEEQIMSRRTVWTCGLTLFAAATIAAPHAMAQQQQKPNILFIRGDDVGWMQPSIYHQGLMVGETPNIDRIGVEGAKFSTRQVKVASVLEVAPALNKPGGTARQSGWIS